MSNILENDNIRSQNRIIDLFCYAMLLDIHIFFANALGRLFLGASPIDTAIAYAILIVLLFRALPDLIRAIDARCVLLCLLLLLFITGSIFFNLHLSRSKYQDAIKTAYQSVPLGLLLGSAITDFRLLEEKLCKLGVILAVEMIVSFCIYHFAFQTVWGSGAMGLSYRLLVPSVLMLYRLFKEFKWRYLILAIALILIIILQGSRGPLLSLICFAVIYQFLNVAANRKQVLRNMGFIALFALLFVVFLPNFLEWLTAVTEQLGFSSKFLRVMLEGDFFTPNGRDVIAEDAWKLICENPFGNGFFGERHAITTYCHNIFLELLVDFGVLFGSIFGFAYVGLILKKFRSGNIAERNVLNMLFCAFLIKLFFSGSFWTEPVFFAFLAFLIKPNNILNRNIQVLPEIGKDFISDETNSAC